MFCKAHGGGRRCMFLGCMRGAEGSTPFCKGHGGGKRCTSEGCTKRVHGGTLLCVSHGGGKRCAMPECTKSARGRTNYCVRHGGGKRCKFEGCTKSAQGSTDFCKAHGGGKRCNWAQLGLEFGGQSAVQCDKFARGKSGLCAAHSAQALEKQINTSFETVSTTQNGEASMSTPMNMTNNCGTSNGSIDYGHQLRSTPISPPENFFIGNSCFDHLSLPEGRVHGGSLMAMLRGGAKLKTGNDNQEGRGQAEMGKSNKMPHSWM
ncbi:hypothetical protein CDL12_07218 [Handroanthus impetiginosus]|uniref:WRKY19-like zinc finger domain-containing protein n=1 Tax=Handroanthus impetiginosus TaxID=429701 RepID=A0A2G9HRD8_9LAMI|nr:hypothetical protein CDL12_07218 [Handroanthus impetiginosus]